ncbi:acetylornithine deacetylase [Strigomonas culicis]|uniref:Acetylornithine deacetylase n=1 Tax=Strigomonas culicis TaxID=28005 RepID=S9W4X4_9TRYP|nr:acetylornithine deacetylase [Strigomonas culicis]|eukprot:EPY30945.1 acetylornithine deacetylase [Strigomonas culicis]
MVERDGRLYGRGTCDMKGFIAVALALVPELLLQRGALQKPVHLAFTYSEETNMCGARLILSKLREHQCDGCIIGEPTDMALVVAHKGLCHHIYESRGLAAHSSLQTSGHNALQATTEMLAYLFALRKRLSEEGPFEEGYDIPYTTLCPAMIQGGIATNIIPEYCKLNFDIRNVAADNMTAHIDNIVAFVAKQNEAMGAAKAPEGCGASITHLNAVPAFAGEKSSAVYRALAAAHQQAAGAEKVSYVTEAGYYQPLTPTVVCGPGSVDQAHKPDEFVDVRQLQLCVAVMRDAVRRMCGGEAGPSSTS